MRLLICFCSSAAALIVGCAAAPDVATGTSEADLTSFAASCSNEILTPSEALALFDGPGPWMVLGDLSLTLEESRCDASGECGAWGPSAGELKVRSKMTNTGRLPVTDRMSYVTRREDIKNPQRYMLIEGYLPDTETEESLQGLSWSLNRGISVANGRPAEVVPQLNVNAPGTLFHVTFWQGLAHEAGVTPIASSSLSSRPFTVTSKDGSYMRVTRYDNSIHSTDHLRVNGQSLHVSSLKVTKDLCFLAELKADVTTNDDGSTTRYRGAIEGRGAVPPN